VRTSRRVFLLTYLEGCAGASIALACRRERRESASAHTAEVAGVCKWLYDNSPEVEYVGAACLAALAGANRLEALAAEAAAALQLHSDNAWRIDNQAARRAYLARRLAAHVKQDFSGERLIEVDGMLLARCEAVCMAMAVSHRRG
jgi:hypothetical protein